MQLKVLQWNVENLFLFLDYYNQENFNEISENQWQGMTSSLRGNKPLVKVQEIAQIILQENPDVCVFCEVGGTESLNNLNKYFLKDRYLVKMRKSNSRRGIDVGFLVRKELPWIASVKTNRFLKLDSRFQEDSKFSRDIPELRFYNQQQVLQMVIMGLHFKSKASLGEDYFGIETRSAEVRGLVKIYNRVQNKYQVPIIVAGDFNGELHEDSEFNPLWEETDLQDCLIKQQPVITERATFVRMDPYKLSRLDYVLSCPRVQVQSMQVIKFKTFYDIEMPFPTSWNEKKKLPSDHYPQIMVCEINIKE